VAYYHSEYITPMDQVNTLRKYGLFDAKVPRYTSYPPANRFVEGVGAQHQQSWLEAVPAENPLSLYVHIPFCKRLCWFCACRTQGTKTLKPVAAYISTLIAEIEATATKHLPANMQMARLHLGGGTPTLLSAGLMEALLESLYQQFTPSADFEFSVEIDPTQAEPDVLDVLSQYKMARASIGVQDFDPKVQKAIGRTQSVAQTEDVIARLRGGGVHSINIDLLYGLPYQTAASLTGTLDRVIALKPDRIALYGYAHVPHVSKRQVMIPDDALPNPERRFLMSQIAQNRMLSLGYHALGIDHFALPHDSLARAARCGKMRRNFQGYTDDPCDTLLGFGASAISSFPQGFTQNAAATSAYSKCVVEQGSAARKGCNLSADDAFVAALIDAIMCEGQIDFRDIVSRFEDRHHDLEMIVDDLITTFPDLLTISQNRLGLRAGLQPAARLVASQIDKSLDASHRHSVAI